MKNNTDNLHNRMAGKEILLVQVTAPVGLFMSANGIKELTLTLNGSKLTVDAKGDGYQEHSASGGKN